MSLVYSLFGFLFMTILSVVIIGLTDFILSIIDSKEEAELK